MTMERRAWTRNELLAVLALYHQLPFGKMHARERAVRKTAAAIGRTPSAIALKLVNFASLDPDLRQRGIRGMGNSSRADRQIWDEFYGRWEALAEASVVDALEDELPLPSSRPVPSPPSGPTEVVRSQKVRKGQAYFRAVVIAAHDWKCCLTGISALELLRASHIVPWSVNPSLRLDPHNGLCLNALHDAAFDRGLITFSDNFELRISKRLKREVPPALFKEAFEKRCGTSIAMPERLAPSAELLEFHRANIFRP